MPTRLTRPGTLAYALITLLLAYQVVYMVRFDGIWGTGKTWAAACLLLVVLISAVLFGVATISRTPLFGDGDHLLTRFGALVLVGLTVLALAVVMFGGFEDFGLWPSSPAVFVPFGVNRLERAYFEGVDETRRAAAAARAEDL
ncbi:hypothetical protein [Kribbella sp. DT2]|uniref:hypothetical protein n=1 Tax=Kribbella sp. DT2 TaxID=3393427 RepID=UPI003CF7A565